MTTIKILCICDWGQVRSAAMVQYIHELNGKYTFDKLKYEAIAIGEKLSTKKTMKMLKDWANYIIDVRKYLPEDVWRNPRHPELLIKIEDIWKQFAEEHHLE